MSFQAPYIFAKNNIVVLRHKRGQHLRVSPGNTEHVDGRGGHGQFAQWHIEIHGREGGHQVVKLKSAKTGRYLRIQKGRTLNAGGGGGGKTRFKVHKTGQHSAKLESCKFSGQYPAVKPGGAGVGGGGQWTEFDFFRLGSGQPVRTTVVQQVIQQQTTNIGGGGGLISNIISSGGGGGGGRGNFTAEYHFKHAKTVVLRHRKGKYLRVRPGNLNEVDENGGKGQFAQWYVELHGHEHNKQVIKLKSCKSGRYLRIQNGNTLNVGGTGGKLTRFKVHLQGGNRAKLESCQFSGKYPAVQPRGPGVGGGGQWTEFEFFRDDGNTFTGGGYYPAQQQQQQQQQQTNVVIVEQQQQQQQPQVQYIQQQQQQPQVVPQQQVQYQQPQQQYVQQQQQQQQQPQYVQQPQQQPQQPQYVQQQPQQQMQYAQQTQEQPQQQQQMQYAQQAQQQPQQPPQQQYVQPQQAPQQPQQYMQPQQQPIQQKPSEPYVPQQQQQPQQAPPPSYQPQQQPQQIQSMYPTLEGQSSGNNTGNVDVNPNNNYNHNNNQNVNMNVPSDVPPVIVAQMQQISIDNNNNNNNAGNMNMTASVIHPHPFKDALPTIRPNQTLNAEAQADKLREAMKGLGTNERKLIEVTTQHSHAQRMLIRDKYVSKFGRNLMRDLESETRGHFEKLLLSFWYRRGELDARLVYHACEGMGFNTDLLNEILLTRTNAELQAMKTAWQRDPSMVDRVKSETSKMFSNNNYQHLMLGVLAAQRPPNSTPNEMVARADAETLNRYLTQEKEADAKSKFVEIFLNRSWVQIRAISNLFQEVSKKYTLGAAVDKAFGHSSDTSKALKMMVDYSTQPYDLFAKKLHLSMKGMGTKDTVLTRIVATRAESDLSNISNIFGQRYGSGKTLNHWIKKDTSGDYERLLLRACGYE